jgi:hypothetical protein
VPDVNVVEINEEPATPDATRTVTITRRSIVIRRR